MGTQGRYDLGDSTDLIAQLADFSARLGRLERTPQVVSTAIDSRGLDIREGAIRVFDAEGQLRLQMGKLPSGAYDIAAFSTDEPITSVNLATLAFGEVAAFDTTNGSTTTNGYVDLSGTGVGPTVSCIIGDSKRAKVTIGCQLDCTFTVTSGAKCAMSFVVSGATSQAAANDRALVFFLSLTGANATGETCHFIDRASYTHFITDLNPGLNTFTAKYSSGSSGTTANFSDRTLIVEPF